jgi:CDP-diacylglycerol--glycerol-3-phosphate 3-phosphatidyltransferase
MFVRKLPNILTVSRIVIIPVIVALFYFSDNSRFLHRLTAALFLVACITDFFDGYLARAWSIQSKLGKFLDPVADKLLVGAVIVMLVHKDRVDIVPAIAIICREILLSGLREFLADLRISVPVSQLAKWKTAIQMTAIFLILLGAKGSGIEVIEIIGRIALWLAAGLTLFTGHAYLKAALIYLNEEEGYFPPPGQ